MDMDKAYDFNTTEGQIYAFWEKGGWFTPKIDKKKKPFSIILPLPNANDPMHMGHALFTIEDILIRYHRMLGEPTLWLPGGDHAGIETQYVFEKKLAKEGKSRFDFDRKTLYQMIKDYADENRDINKGQMKILGFSMDWTRYHYSLEPKIVEMVLQTFKQLYNDGLIYRDHRMVNYCTKCGTAFSDLEVDHEEKDDLLYYLDYGPISIATTRPETIFADVAVAVNPKDKKNNKLIDQKAIIPLINREIPIIEDKIIEIGYGTGALKVTPAHDPTDYEIGQRHQLTIIESIDKNGRMINVPEKYLGMKVFSARQAVVEDLKNAGKLIKTEPLKHTVSVCYRCKTTIEPMLIPQWYIKTKSLAEPAVKAVKEGKTKIVPKKRFEKMYFDWMNNIHDWNISRQIVWGPRIPAWYCLDCNPDILINFINKQGEKISATYKNLISQYSFAEIKEGLQSLSAPVKAEYSIVEEETCRKCSSEHVLQETDTFDTWFLSSQWPVNTLQTNSEDFKYFYPTSVLDTLWDILFFWVARMMMMGIYKTGDIPFKVIHLHARVVDKFGRKMSKSKGNTINPLEMINKYSADALRMALVYGVSPSSDVVLSDDKVRSMRNFTTKLWNAARFVITNPEVKSQTSKVKSEVKKLKLHKDDEWILKETEKVSKQVTNYINNYRFDLALDIIYQFFWHTFCDKYIEMTKTHRDQSQETLVKALEISLKLLHPFMPFITEQIWQTGRKNKSLTDLGYFNSEALIIAQWPK